MIAPRPPSDRVSDRLQAILAGRSKPDDPAYVPSALTLGQFATLRAVMTHVIPQASPSPIDLAARLDRTMAEASGNGWRYEALPADPQAYALGLETLDRLAMRVGAARYVDLTSTAQYAILAAIGGEPAEDDPPEEAPFSAAQMRLWFEELRSDAVRLYVAHPAVMASIGYSGTRNGADGGAAFEGFSRIGIGEREDFEPVGDGSARP